MKEGWWCKGLLHHILKMSLFNTVLGKFVMEQKKKASFLKTWLLVCCSSAVFPIRNVYSFINLEAVIYATMYTSSIYTSVYGYNTLLNTTQ